MKLRNSIDEAGKEVGCVVRVPKAYPVYGSDYREALAVVREFVDSLENFRTIGRNGLHRYNNQDHAMLTGMLAARSMVLGEQHDLWSVNADQEYHEEVREPARHPADAAAAAVEEEMARVFLRVDRVAFGLARHPPSDPPTSGTDRLEGSDPKANPNSARPRRALARPAMPPMM